MSLLQQRVQRLSAAIDSMAAAAILVPPPAELDGLRRSAGLRRRTDSWKLPLKTYRIASLAFSVRALGGQIVRLVRSPPASAVLQSNSLVKVRVNGRTEKSIRILPQRARCGCVPPMNPTEL